MTEQELDVRGLRCPLPVLRTRACLERMAAGDELVVVATDPASAIDMRHFCNVTGHELVAHEEREGEFVYRIRRRT